ncbi:MAG: hypothetical protein WBL72_23080 [Thermoguttaceae bacterium]
MARKCAVRAAIGMIFAASALFMGACPLLGQVAATKSPPAVAVAKPPALAADVEQAIRWLPEDTESIVVVQGPLQHGTLKDFRDPPPPPVVSVGSASSPFQAVSPATPGPPTLTFDAVPQPEADFRQEMLGASTQLFGLAGEAFIENISKHGIRFVVEAARQFGRPVIGSASTYEGCELIVFDRGVPDAPVRAREKEKLAIEQIGNNRVVRIDTDARWGEKDERLSVWYAKPKPNVLIAATNARFLSSILQRIGRPGAPPSSLLGFPEWKYVDTKSSVWGVRHRRTNTEIYIISRPWDHPPPALIGVTFSYQPRPTESVAYRLHFAEETKNPLSRAVNDKTGMKLVAPTVAERRITLHKGADTGARDSATRAYMCFLIQHVMGYVVCP